jgi:biotin transport system permease protein
VTSSPLGEYITKRSPLHRLRPGAKLLGLFLFGIFTVAFRSVPVGLVALAIGVTLALLSGMRMADLLRVGRRFLIVGVLLFAFQAWQRGWEHGFAVVATLFALLLAASALTASTAADELIDTIVWLLGPLRRFGVKPDQVALAFSLTIRSIPIVLAQARETRAAAKARGLERSPRAYLVPFVLRVVAHAQLTGEALQARGFGDD